MKTEDTLTLLDKPKTIFTVIAYEDTASRDHACHTCDQLLTKLHGELEFDFSWWRFAYLHDAALAQMAAADAIQADVIIVAAKPDGEFPESLTQWLESWVFRKQNLPSALVGLLGGADEPRRMTSPRHASLSNFATLAGMDYLFCLPTDALHPWVHTDNPFETIQRRVETMTPVMQSILDFHPPERRWGIND